MQLMGHGQLQGYPPKGSFSKSGEGYLGIWIHDLAAGRGFRRIAAEVGSDAGSLGTADEPATIPFPRRMVSVAARSSRVQAE